jgi:hypothetical protein
VRVGLADAAAEAYVPSTLGEAQEASISRSRLGSGRVRPRIDGLDYFVE